MTTYLLKIVTKSEASFGRGDGLAGVVDAEVQHDEYGCPYLGGRTLKGMLVNVCADILDNLPDDKRAEWQSSAARLFGQPGSTEGDSALLRIGDAQLPAELRQAIHSASNPLERADILETLTTIRRQTAMDETGVPQRNSLRAIRLLQREIPFFALLQFEKKPNESDLALLAACAKAFRRAGTGRTRGRGKVEVSLLDHTGKDITIDQFKHFSKEVLA